MSAIPEQNRQRSTKLIKLIILFSLAFMISGIIMTILDTHYGYIGWIFAGFCFTIANIINYKNSRYPKNP